MLLVHQGGDKLWKNLRKVYCYPNVEKDVIKFVTNGYRLNVRVSTRDLLSQVGSGIGFKWILLIVFDD